MTHPRIVVGASHGGSELAAKLRQLDPSTPVLLIGDEPQLPYQRPPLSKSWLAQPDAEITSLLIRDANAYAAAGVQTRINARVEEIDRGMQQLRLASGETLRYSQLAITMGARPRRLVITGSERADQAPNFHYLRTLGDVQRLRPQFEAGARIAIIGGGYIGLELAALSIKCGLKPAVYEAQPRVLARVTAPRMSVFYAEVHRAAGVELFTGVQITGFEFGPCGEIQGVSWNAPGGTPKDAPADIVVAGIGVLPNIELAEAAGLKCAPDGLTVDEHCRTSDPAIVAAGDCTSRPVQGQTSNVRIESVPNAVEQARTAAATLCGLEQPCTSVPWFWSDQYDLKLQMVGLSQGHDEVVIRGDIAARAFSTFYLKDGAVIAADSVNRPADFMNARKLIATGVRAGAGVLADTTRELKRLVAA